MKSTKKVLLISACAMILGLLLCTIGFFSGGAKSVSVTHSGIHLQDTASHTLNNLNLEDFQSIDLNIQQADIEFVQSEHYGIDICYYDTIDKPVYSVENSILKVSDKAKKEFTFFNMDFGIFHHSNTIKIYLPANAQLTDVKINNSYGNLNLNNLTAQTVDIHAPFGNVNMQDVASATSIVTVDSGNLTIKNLKTNSLTANNNFGDITIDGLTVSQLNSQIKSGNCTIRNSTTDRANVINDFGDITAKNIATTQLDAKCKSGNINLNGTFGGNTVLHADFGDIDFSTSIAESQYGYSLSDKFGDIKVNGSKDAPQVKQNDGAANNLTASNNSGNININFKK